MHAYHQQDRAPADAPRSDGNASVSLKAYLQNIDATVKKLPSAWVKCELHTLKTSPKFVKMEFIELDQSGKQVAKANGGCFPSTWQRIGAAFSDAGLPIEEGSQVLVKLEASVNAAYGFNVNVLDIDVTFALGDLNARIQGIRKSLRDAGIWDRNRRLERPTDFLRVAVISPSGAAGLGDFRSTADRLVSTGLVQFDYHEAPFQTRDAPARIVDILRSIYRAGMEERDRQCAVAIIRGGGASADLAWLIDQKLTEAVCRMNLPVMTGIGHERDKNLLDEVACIACDTPSKVAEHISRVVTQSAMAGQRSYDAILSQARQYVDRSHADILDVGHMMSRDAQENVRSADLAVRNAASGIEPGARQLLEATDLAVAQKLEESRTYARTGREDAATAIQGLCRQIEVSGYDSLHHLELGTAKARSEISARTEAVPAAMSDEVNRLIGHIEEVSRQVADTALAMTAETGAQIVIDARRMVDDCERTISAMEERADALHPKTILAAGYVILRGPDGAPLTSAVVVANTPQLHAEMRDGAVYLAPCATDPANPPVAPPSTPKPKRTPRKAKPNDRQPDDQAS